MGVENPFSSGNHGFHGFLTSILVCPRVNLNWTAIENPYQFIFGPQAKNFDPYPYCRIHNAVNILNSQP